MSLLQLHPNSPGRNEILNGEDVTRGSSHILVATAAAAVVLVIAIAIFVMAIQKPPVAAGTITGVYTHAVHSLNTAPDTNGDATSGTPYDQVLVMASLTLRNQSDKPIILRDMVTNVTLPDGPHSSMAATPGDYDRVFQAYPELAGLKTHTFTRDTMLQPGETIDGMLVSAFHVNDQTWAAHQDLNVTLRLQSHPDVVLTPGAAPEVK